MKIGFMVIRNGIRLGYPFVEALASVHKCCDQFLVFDCGSDDGTDKVLKNIVRINGKFSLHNAPWPKHSAGGNAIAQATNDAMKHPAVAGAKKAIYLQADEIYHETSMPYLLDYMGSQNFKSTSFKFLHFRNSLLHYISNPTYDKAIRIITPQNTFSLQDGFNFGGNVDPVYQTGVHIFHMGWCFPYNICQKHINHAKLYPGNGRYEGAKRICEEMVNSGNLSRERLMKEVDGYYKVTAFHKEGMPRYVSHLFNQEKYDPNIGLARLESDLK